MITLEFEIQLIITSKKLNNKDLQPRKNQVEVLHKDKQEQQQLSAKQLKSLPWKAD